jgi:hypothetical protein
MLGVRADIKPSSLDILREYCRAYCYSFFASREAPSFFLCGGRNGLTASPQEETVMERIFGELDGEGCSIDWMRACM